MRLTSTPFVPLNPFMLWFQWSSKVFEMMVASQQVIAARTSRMATAGLAPNARDRKEFMQMGTEKALAAAESMAAVMTRLVANPFMPGTNVWRQWSHGWMEAPHIAAAALAPIHRRATANARRLGAKRTSRGR